MSFVKDVHRFYCVLLKILNISKLCDKSSVIILLNTRGLEMIQMTLAVQGWLNLSDWCLTAFSAQTGYIVP